MKEVVHCITQEEFNFVTEKLGYGKFSDPYNQYSCIRLDVRKRGSKSLYETSKYKIYTFEEWLIKENITINNKKTMKKLMLDVLEKTYNNLELRRTIVPLFMSSPGIGKTNITEEFIKNYIESKGNKMVTMVLPNLMPNEAVGGVYPNQITKVWEFYDSEKLANLKDGDCLFLDEVFNGTLKQTLDAMLNVLGQRRLGSGKKMADVMIVAASNPQGLINLTPQIKERFQHIPLEFNAEEYQKYLKEKYGMPNNISTHLCTIIKKEKFQSEDWNYNSPRSIEKALKTIGYGIETSYDAILLPYLTTKIKLPKDIEALNYKAEDEIEYLQVLKLICKAMDDKLKGKLIPEVIEKKVRKPKAVKAEKQLEEVTS